MREVARRRRKGREEDKREEKEEGGKSERGINEETKEKEIDGSLRRG